MKDHSLMMASREIISHTSYTAENTSKPSNQLSLLQKDIYKAKHIEYHTTEPVHNVNNYEIILGSQLVSDQDHSSIRWGCWLDGWFT